MEKSQDDLPAVDIDANGVVRDRVTLTSRRVEPVAAPAQTATAVKPLPNNLSSGVLSVLLQMQDRTR
jgi:hypothetical protein